MPISLMIFLGVITTFIISTYFIFLYVLPKKLRKQP